MPTAVQNAVNSCTGFLLRSTAQVASTIISAINHSTSSNSIIFETIQQRKNINYNNPDININENSLKRQFEGQTLSPSICNNNTSLKIVGKASRLISELRRQHIPIRFFLDIILYGRNLFIPLIPETIDKFLVNCWVPFSPWLPYSVDDPLELMYMTAESCTIGILISLYELGFQVTRYNIFFCAYLREFIASALHFERIRTLRKSSAAF